MINENQYYNWSRPLIQAGEKTSLQAMTRIRSFAVRAVNNPTGLSAYERQVLQAMQKDLALLGRSLRTFSDKELAMAYIRGIESTNGMYAKMNVPFGQGSIPSTQLFSTSTTQRISESALKLLTEAGYANHASYVGAFQTALINDGAKMQFQILRGVQDNLRVIQIEASSSQFLTADKLTRRGFMQGILNRIADEGITGIIYEGGRKVTVEAYAEMLARTTLGNSARQAGVNRSAELGNDLVRTSSHARSSPMCEPWQARVYSLSGESDKYPPLDEAISGGFGHPNCKHTVNPYFEGISPPLSPDGTPEEVRLGDKATYEAEQQQRYNERQIRKWKSRETVAIDDRDKDQAKAKVSEWQAKQRKHIESNDYLKRQYARESI